MSKSIFIVGMGPGIGAATAQRFGHEGWTVVLGSRSPNKLTHFAKVLSDQRVTTHSVALDATSPRDLRAAMAEAERLTGGLSVVHYNAAFVRQQDFFSMTDEEVDSDLAVNVAAGFHTIRAAVETFGKRGGTILITGGGLAVHPSADWASLGAGKAALRNIVEGLAKDLSKRNVRIAIATIATLAAPGSTEAEGAANLLWNLANDLSLGWEGQYPAIS